VKSWTEYLKYDKFQPTDKNDDYLHFIIKHQISRDPSLLNGSYISSEFCCILARMIWTVLRV